VSHHPPIGVANATCDGFNLQLEMELKTKFRGNSSDVFVSGTNQLFIPKFGDEFTWNHLDTCAHNIIVGWMWVDHFGTLEVKNKTTGDKGIITFSRSGWLGAGRFELSGGIYDKDGKLRLKITGKWNEVVCAIKIDKDGNESTPIVIWKKALKELENKWNWSKFNFELNEMSDAYKSVLPPTDSRLRGDRYYLEKDNLEMAGSEKHRLEEKQRTEKKEREDSGGIWDTKYFKQQDDPEFGHKYIYVGKYWEEREEATKPANHHDEEEIIKGIEQVTVNSQDGKQEENQ